MKITIAYLREEEPVAAAILADIQSNYPDAKVHKSDRHPPFKHAYVTTKKPGKPCEFKENTCTTPLEVI